MAKKTDAVKHYLVTWNGNWADEMDLVGRSVFDEHELKEFKDFCKNSKLEEDSYPVGTNEDIYTTPQDYFEGCDIALIPPEAVKFVSDNCDDSVEWSPSEMWCRFEEAASEDEETVED